MATEPNTMPTPDTGTSTDTLSAQEDIYQVVLHNDDTNTMEHVVRCLVQVFGHSLELAVKIMMEAHRKGRAVAEVESKSEAQRHRDQLRSLSLVATIEPI